MSGTFNPFDAAQAHNAWGLLRQLREEGPLAPIDGGMHYVPRYAECREMLRDVESFSNASGFKAPGVVIPAEDRLLGELDPPRHTLVRRVMVTALSPTVVRGAETFIRETAGELLAAVQEEGSADLVPAFTVPLPNRVTVHLLGLPPEDATTIAGWAKELMESGFPATNRSERGEGFALAFPDFAAYIDDTIDRRAAETSSGIPPRQDVLSRLLALEVDGEHLPHRQVRALVRNLITGGLTTTSQLLGNLLYQLLTVPGLEGQVRADDSLLSRAIEESLRIAPPVLFIPRGCVRDTIVGGAAVHSGERVVVGTASANRDERVFSDADEFRLDRPDADQHLTFGAGPHVCPGATLARTVTRVGVSVFLSTFAAGSVQLADGFVYENVPTFFECGPRRLPIERMRPLPG
jgi:cytochrome P450